jgi:hypothetical protein
MRDTSFSESLTQELTRQVSEGKKPETRPGRIIMRGTVITKHRGRCTRNLLLMNLCALAAVGWVLWTWGSYFLGLLPGRIAPAGVTARPTWVDYVWAAVLLGTGGLAAWNVLKALYRLTPPGRVNHPIVQDLCRFGDPEQVATALTEEVHDGAERYCRGRVVLTRSWLLHATVFHLGVIRLDDVVWAYKQVTQHRSNGLPTGRDFAVALRDVNGWTWEIRGREKEVDCLLAALCTQLPWIFEGYDEAWERDWLFNRDAMLRAVEFRRKLTRFALAQPAGLN